MTTNVHGMCGHRILTLVGALVLLSGASGELAPTYAENTLVSEQAITPMDMKPLDEQQQHRNLPELQEVYDATTDQSDSKVKGTAHTDSLLQVGQGGWTPSGQSGLEQDIVKAHADEDKKKLKQDGLSGTSMLSAGGLSNIHTDSQDDDDEDSSELLQDSIDGDGEEEDEGDGEDMLIDAEDVASYEGTSLLQVGTAEARQPVSKTDTLKKVFESKAAESSNAYKVAEMALQKLAWDSNSISEGQMQFTEPPYQRIKQAQELLLQENNSVPKVAHAETNMPKVQAPQVVQAPRVQKSPPHKEVDASALDVDGDGSDGSLRYGDAMWSPHEDGNIVADAVQEAMRHVMLN